MHPFLGQVFGSGSYNEPTAKGPGLGERMLVCAQVPVVLSTAYLLTLLAAAVSASRETGPELGHGEMDLLVVVPAHNEATGIARTIRSLQNVDYPANRRTIVVVADNCTDATASVARREGAVVLERVDLDRRGKGWALTAALPELLRNYGPDAVVVVDADCEVSENLLRVVEARLHNGAAAVQVAYRVSNASVSPAAALRAAAFALMGTVRPLGRERLRLSCGLQGTGMALSRKLLEEQPWRAVGLAEDAEYHACMVLGGHRSEFDASAAVYSEMPWELKAGVSQQQRWEAGKVALLRKWCSRLARRAIRGPDARAAHCALDMLVPPLSLLAASNTAVAGVALTTGARTAFRIALVSGAGLATFVIGGMRLVHAPAAAYRALALGPLFIVRKLKLYLELGSGAVPERWIRTPRDEQA